jgi:surface protein
LNESNTYLFINNEKYKYKNYFEPKNAGKYKIYLVFKNIIEDCSYMFANCKDIKKINLKPFKIENNINMSHMFDGCQGLKYLDPPEMYSIKAIKGLSYLFKDCKNLEEIDLSFIPSYNIDTTDISHMFEGCENLKKVNIEYLNTKKVTNMSYVFKDCKNISNEFEILYREKSRKRIL